MCSLLGLNKRLQNKRTPGHAEMDQLDTSGEVSPDQARVFPTCVGILLYLASDLPRCQHVVRHLSTYSTQPTTCSMTILRHLVSYLACHEDICVSLRWRGRNSGLFHQYGSAAEYAMEIFTDSDWASNKETRRSISCSTIFLGNCLLYSSSRTQKLVSLSSAEAEVYACSSGASDGLLLAGIISWWHHDKEGQHVGHAERLELVPEGLWWRTWPRQSTFLGYGAFTAIFVLVVLLVWWFWSGNHHDNANQFEPDAEPDAHLAHNPAVHDEDVEMSVAAEAEPQELQRREPNAEDDVSCLIERCERRRLTAQDGARRFLYNERITILHGLQSAMKSEHAGWRRAALQSLATLPDISDDENSPNFASINAPVVNFGDAQRAMSFIASLQAGQPSSSASGFSTNVDMVANSLIRNLDYDAAGANSDVSLVEETASEVRARYRRSTQSEVSDPGLWILMQHEESHESESPEFDEMDCHSW